MRFLAVIALICWHCVAQAESSLSAWRNGTLELVSSRPSPVLQLTKPDGETLSFPLRPSVVMSPELAARFPEIKTWSGTCSSRPEISIRCDQSPLGIYAQIFSPDGTVYINQPVQGRNAFRGGSSGEGKFSCLTEPVLTKEGQRGVPDGQGGALNQIYSFRLAVTTSGEYTQFHGGTVPSTMAAIVTVFNRVNGIYERELGVRLVLAEGTSQVIFTNNDTDPYTSNNPTAATVQEAQATLDSVVGSTNYDLGILLNTGTYGLAYSGSVCDPQRKGSACMGLPAPEGEIFAIYVAHEMSHQFGANHTFNSEQGPCGGSRNPATAVEPGTGSTLLSYAGLPCANDSLQPLMSDYFHARSIQEVHSFLNNISCAELIASSNHLPAVSAPSSVTIPRGTPFRLTATGSDPDGDTVKFCWEQMDVGPAQSLASTDNGSSPLFRSFLPTTNNFRTFPHWSSLLQNVASPGEQLPATNRAMHFRVTVRDSKNEGATTFADTHVQVVATAGPFRITSHNEGGNFVGGQTVTWDVAGTSLPPISATQVNILLSTNGGNSFPLFLATNTPNDGAQVVQFPVLGPTNQVRLMIQPVGHVFFDINEFPFTSSVQPIINAVSITNGQVRLRWSFVNGQTYQVQARQTLFLPWEDVPAPITTQGNQMEALVPLGSWATRFFRIRGQ